MSVISIGNLVKTFGAIRALDGLDLHVEQGGARLPRAQRLREVHHHPHPARVAPP